MIRVLDEETINKIAAGEVIDKPLNVVKELVENSIDAGSTMITVEIKGGGIDYIRVTDNGKGIPKNEVKTAFLRHATSKISSDEDLHYLTTLGFRGEALASIAAVSMVEMCTKTEEDLAGIRVVIQGGEITEFEEVGAPRGTTTVVRNLFYNVPPRKKFLKSAAAEGAAIAETVQHLALAMPRLSIKFVQNGSVKFMTSGNGKLKDVIYRIYGRSTSDELIPVMIEQDGVKVEGYIGRPSIARSNRNDENYYINNRYIKSKEISGGLEEGYKAFLMMHRFPFCVLHFSMDTTTLDVNIHPNKMQVRMEHPEIIVRLLADNIHDALLEKDLIPQVKLTEEKERKETIKAPEPFETKRIENESASSKADFMIDTNSVHAEHSTFDGNAGHTKDDGKALHTKDESHAGHSDVEIRHGNTEDENNAAAHFFTKQVLFDDASDKPSEPAGSILNSPSEPADGILNAPAEKKEISQSSVSSVIVEEPEQYTLYDPEFFAEESKEEFEVIGQIFDTYWLITLGNKLYFMDQHAAHEKIKYEEFMKRFREGNLESQNLLPPCIISLKPSEYVIFDKYRDAFAGLMFEIDDFGQDTIALRAMPTDLFGYSPEELFMDILEELAGVYSAKSITTVEERIATRACKSAIKGNTPLTKDTAKQLIEMLFTLENPYQCPHGRPTLFSMSEYEIEKKFKRIL